MLSFECRACYRILIVMMLLVVPAVAASDTEEETTGGIRLGEVRTQRFQVGVKIQAVGECRGIMAAIPMPMDWPEQQVQIIEESISPEVRSVKYRVLPDGAKQMLVQIPRLARGEKAEAVLTLSISRQVILGPEQVDEYQIPKRLSRDIRKYLGSGPFIETRNARIRKLALSITRDKESAWAKVETIYDYVRENVQYRESELKGAIQTLNDGVGDCEAMTSLFIAMCRAIKIPARMVWVTDHSYPEFYLVDAQQQGHWFPCQIAGSRALGSMPETRAILQKGDNYKIPETGERRRYVATQLKAAAVRGGAPKITEILQQIQ